MDIFNNLVHSEHAILKSLRESREVDDRACKLQDVFKSSAAKSSDLTQDLISLLHKPGVPLSRNTQSSGLPSPATVFEELLQSNDEGGGQVHPNGIASLVSAFLSIAHLSLRPPNSNAQTRTPCFDLYPLYGDVSTSDSDKIRKKEGYGILSPDCFHEDRLIFLSSATTVLLILFNRNHNYIARRLFLQQEEFVDDFRDDAHRNQQDDAIFQKARLINCGLFRNIMLEDVLKPLVGLAGVGPSHGIDFLSEPGSNARVPIGNGIESNHIEAALLYDSPEIMSQQEVLQVQNTLQNLFDEENRDLNTISPGDFDEAVNSHSLFVNTNKRQRNYAGLPRREDGYFEDADLAKILHDATECPARNTGTGIPSPLRIMQMKTIEWAREGKACSFVDYRRSLGLKVPRSFEEWTSNRALANTAGRLYGRIEDLDVYVGLQLEDTVPESKDLGFCFGYTKTYGLLVDIISRIRNDPALIKDLTPANVTSWGAQDCVARQENGSFGMSLPKLLQRTLPRQYIYNNIYGLFPFSTPIHTVKCLENLFASDPSALSKYDTLRPRSHKVHRLVTQDAINQVFQDPASFPTPYGENLAALTGGYGYLLGFDDEIKHDRDQMMSLHALMPDSRAPRRYAESFSMIANDLIREKTSKGGEIDVARDVINAVCTQWVSDTLLDYPLAIAKKDDKQVEPDLNKDIFQRYIRDPVWKWLGNHEFVRKIAASLKERIVPRVAPELPIEELSDKFASIYAFAFQNFTQEEGWMVRETALRTSAILCAHIRQKIPAAGTISDQSYFGFLKDSVDNVQNSIFQILQEFTMGTKLQEKSAKTFLSTMVYANQKIPPSEGPADEARIVANILGFAVVASVKYAKVCTQAVNFYLQEKYSTEREKIVELSKKDDIESKKLLMGYIREAYRLDHPFGLWRQTQKKVNGYTVEDAEPGDMIFADFRQALRDPEEKVDPKRLNTQALQGFGLHKCPGFSFVDETMPEIFKAIFRLGNIRRSKNKKDPLRRFSAHPQLHDMSEILFINPQSVTVPVGNNTESTPFKLGPYPQSLKLEYDVKETSCTDGAAKNNSSPPKPSEWKIVHGKDTKKMRSTMDMTAFGTVVLTLALRILNMIFSILSISSSAPPAVHLPPEPSPPQATPTSTIAGCPLPTSVINPWETITMHVGEDGNLLPIEYTLDLATGHRLSFVDLDEKDMRMRLVVDNIVWGVTPEVTLNKSEFCGENYADCLNKQFSGGDIVLPKGRHTVRLEWAGVETPGPDGKIDWGEKKGRRLGWARTECGP